LSGGKNFSQAQQQNHIEQRLAGGASSRGGILRLKNAVV
jgi:hypothetical protein